MNDRNQSDINTVLQNGYSVEIGNFISRGWDIIQLNLVGFILFTLFTSLIATISVFFSVILFFTIIGIPLVFLIPILISPLFAGNIIVAFKLIKQQPVEFGDFFKGYSNINFLPLFLASLVMGIFGFIPQIPGQAFNVLVALSSGSSSSAEPNFTLLVLTYFFQVIGWIGASIITVFYSLTIPLIVGRKMAFWTAMETSRKLVAKNWISWIFLFVIITIINILGFLACCVGLLITSPLSACIVAAAYEGIIGLPNGTTEENFA